jgi:hypothetical protein
MDNKQKLELVFEDHATAGALELLLKKYPKDIVHDMSDDSQFKEARKTRTERNKLLDAIKRCRIDFTNEVKDHEQSLCDLVNGIFNPIVIAFETEDTRRKEVKKAAEEKEKIRIEEMKKAVDDILHMSEGAHDIELSELNGRIEAVSNIDPTDFDSEITKDIIEAKTKTLDILLQARTNATQRKAMTLESRVANLKSIPMEYFGKGADEIELKIKALKFYQPLRVDLESKYEEVCEILPQIIEQLEMMHSMAEAKEQSNTKPDIDNAQRVVDDAVIEQPTTYQRLFFLGCLISAGVDNWDGGYDMAVNEYLKEFPLTKIPSQ